MGRRRFLSMVAALGLVTSGAILATNVAPANADALITCSANLQYPHSSNHQPGTVNVVVNIGCDGPVNEIASTIFLDEDGHQVNSNFDNEGGAGIIGETNNVSAPCQSGHTYSASVSFTAWFPAYYNGQRVGLPSQTTVSNPTPSFVVVCDGMSAGSQLDPGAILLSRNGVYRLVMQSDGNLVVYGPQGATWASCTERWPGSVAQMQGDGNLVVYGPGHIARYATGTGVPGAWLWMQDDGNLVIYVGSVGSATPVWASSAYPRLC